jgi:S-DNA-T family DNA segregation ATPase FtsK/SpoIIIE
MIDRQAEREEYEREAAERAAAKEQYAELKKAEKSLPEIPEETDEKSDEVQSPFSHLRIKGASLFRGNDDRSDEAEKAEEFTDLPENQRKIMHYMKDETLWNSDDNGNAEYKDQDEDLNSYRAADFFYDIKSIPERMKESHEQEDPFETLSWDTDDDIIAEIPEEIFPETEVAPSEETVPEYVEPPKEMTRGEIKAAVAEGAAVLGASINQMQEEQKKKEYKLPPVSLLNTVNKKVNRNEQKELSAKAARLEQVLHDFGVNAHVIDVKKGPSVTRYEIQPATGVKVNSITKLADDIALNLEAKSLRIEAPIPGKAAVGIEVENDSSSTVSIRQMIESSEFKKSNSKISFVVGEDISGNHVVADLKGMPHLLIAGSTGSGKSVCINSIIISMLYKSTPDEVKFILIDPKVVELGNYNGIPHMLIPVVTDPSKAAAALAWAVQEMNDRYKKFAETSVRDLKAYNEKMEKEGHEENVLPQIVIIIDELADLMMAAAKQVEESICRLAQLARAAGMHLIVATQRPSVDVVTGLIKANVPSRIAFAVSSQVDSRTILDRAGAEKLVGKGDMLFYPLGKAQPERLQGPFVTDDEVSAVIDFWKEQADTDNSAAKILDAINTVMPEVPAEDGDDEDELLSDAIELVISSGQASASMLQRRYRIGYNRAGRLIDIMEARGIIGKSEGSKPRKVLVSKDEYENRSNPPVEAAAVPDMQYEDEID